MERLGREAVLNRSALDFHRIGKPHRLSLLAEPKNHATHGPESKPPLSGYFSLGLSGQR